MIVQPHGGKLINRQLSASEASAILACEKNFYKMPVSGETAVELQNIAIGLYSPLEGFMNRDDFLSVIHNNRLSSGYAWTIPIVLDAGREELKNFERGSTILLTLNNKPIASMFIEDIFTFNISDYCRQVFGTEDSNHPGVAAIKNLKEYLIGGPINLLIEPQSEFPDYFLTPRETRVLFKQLNWNSVVGFQTRNVPHLGHEYVQKTAQSTVDGLFINPVIGKKKKGDFTDEVILNSYKVLIDNYYVREHTVLAILQTEMRYAGPKEAIFHAIVRKNYGCSHFIIGRDHAGVGNYYHPFAAQKIFDQFPDLGITPIFFMSFFFCKKCNSIANDKTCPHSQDEHIDFAGKLIREKLLQKEPPPASMMRPEVAAEIIRSASPLVE